MLQDFVVESMNQYWIYQGYVLLLNSYFVDYEDEIDFRAIFDNVLPECYVCQKAIC